MSIQVSYEFLTLWLAFGMWEAARHNLKLERKEKERKEGADPKGHPALIEAVFTAPLIVLFFVGAGFVVCAVNSAMMAWLS